jgi:hypothetical protein
MAGNCLAPAAMAGTAVQVVAQMQQRNFAIGGRLIITIKVAK